MNDNIEALVEAREIARFRMTALLLKIAHETGRSFNEVREIARDMLAEEWQVPVRLVCTNTLDMGRQGRALTEGT